MTNNDPIPKDENRCDMGLVGIGASDANASLRAGLSMMGVPFDEAAKMLSQPGAHVTKPTDEAQEKRSN